MQETICHEDRKARKMYTCDYCGGKIEKGEVYHYYKGKYDGSLFDWRSHLACQRVADAIWEYVEFKGRHYYLVVSRLMLEIASRIKEGEKNETD